MANNPTILVSSLDDSQMKQSIANLVADVKRATHTMTKDFDSVVDHINAKFKELGNGKNVSAKGGVSANATSTKQETDAIEKHTEAIKKNTAAKKENAQVASSKPVTFDQMAQAQQTVAAPKSARDSYLAFMKGYKEQAQMIARQIQEAENALNSAVTKRLASLNQQIDNAKRKLNELYSMKTISESYDGSGLKTNTNRINSQIEQEMRKIADLQERINRLSGDMVRPDLVQRIGNLYTEYSRISNIMKDDAVTSQQQLNTESKKTAEIEKQAKAIRESKDWNTKGSVLVNDRVYYNPEKVKGVKSLEEQILQTIKDQEIAEIRKASAAQSAAAAHQAELQQSKAILDTETRITEEINKRKKYSSPDMQVGYDVTRDKLAQIIAGKNNIQVNQVVNWDEQKSSIKTLSAALKQYQDTYAKMSAIERNSPFGKQIISDIQVLERNIQKVRREMSRPLSFSSAMAGSERTLDDIALKMQRLRAYKQGIDITKPNAANDIKQVDDALAKLQRDMDKYMSKSKQVNEINTALGRSWNYMKNRLAFYFTVGATTQFVKSLVDIRGQYELLERSIGILVDSAQNGSRIFAELNAMAIKSPFTTMELGAAAKQLVAYDVAAKDVVDTTKRLADMAAAVGVPIERLTYALGQIKSYSYLNARDARMFANTGIPLVKNLADMYTKLEGRLVSTSDVYDRIKKKAVSYNDVMRVVNEMTDEGGKFFNFQEKAADTLKVKIANLSLAYNNMLNEIGKSNQGFISGGLGALKTLMEHWRDVYNTILALVPAYGAAKIAQLLLYKAVNKTTMATAAQAVFSEKLVAKWQAVTVAAKGATAASIGVSLATAGILALVAVLGKLAWDYYDLKQANEDFNKSVIDGAEENIQSISKFFDDYKKELKEISGASSSDQDKMWERMQEEIEKTVSNAQDYIDILEKIDDTASRIKAGEAILGQQQVIEQEIKDFASRGMLDLGGGFADDSMAKDLEQYDKWAREFTANFDKMTEQSKKNVGLMLQTYAQNTKEVDAEIDKFIGKLQSLNFEKIMGDFDKQTQFANIRNAVSSIRDGFLATEQGSKIGYEGQARLNAALDKYISSLGRSKNLIQDVTVNGKKYSASQVAAIEANRSAWEKFFSRIKPNQKKMLDFAVKTGRMNAKQLQEIWDYAAKEMQKTDLTAFTSIQDHIAQLRNTPDIVLNIVYKERTEKSKDPVIRDYTEHFLTPSKVWDADTYIKKEEELYKKYGTLIKKEGEDRVEWGERVFKTIHDEEKKAAEATKALAELQKELTTETKRAGDARYQAAKKQKEESEEIIKNAKEVVKYEKLHDKEKKKGKQKDPILEALKLEISLVEKLRADYDKLTKAGESQAGALATIHDAYGKTIKQLNTELKSFKLPQLNIAKIITGKDPKKQLDHFQKTLDALIKNGLLNMERSKEVEAVLEKLKVSAKEYDFTELSKGIEKELGKLKESYELAIEIDANPEEGEIFADFLKLDKKKLAELPRSFGQLMTQLQGKIDKQFSEHGIDLKFDLSEMLNKENFEKWVADNGHTLEDGMAKSLDAIREHLNKLLKDETKQLGSLVSKYGEASAKIEKIYSQNTRRLLSVISAYGDEDAKKLGINLANDLAITTDPETVMRLRDELKTLVQTVADKSQGDAAQNLLDAILKDEKEKVAKALWEGFKDGDYYSVIFDDIKRASTVALQAMKAQLDELKDKVKESPESMKALMSAYSKLREELIERNPFQGMTDALNEGKEALKQYLIATAELDAANRELKQKEEALDALRKKEPRNLIAIYRAEKELSKAKKDVAKKNAEVAKAQNAVTASQEDYKKAIKTANVVIKKLSDALKQVGDTLDNTTGDVIKFIGDILNFVTVVSDSMTTVSQGASKAIQTIEKASVILAIISAAIQLIQELNSLIPDASDKYEKAAKKQAEINKLTDAIVQYRLAVLAARMEEENWFSENSLKKLKNFYSVGREALRDYNEKLMESQAIYQNEQSGGWLTKFAYWTNPATWIQKITGIEGKWADAIAMVGSGLFGAEAQMGQLGIWLTQHANKDVYDYEEGFTAAFNNLRIETKERSKGFLGTGIGGHAQETEDLIKWVKDNLKLDLFDPDFMLNEEAYKTLMDNYADKLVGETKATLEKLHELTEKWNEYIEQLNEYVDSMYSPLVDNMSDAMWAWYDEGKSALDSFKEYASDTFRAIVTDMIKSIILSNFAEKYANDIKEMYKEYSKGGLSEEDLIRGVADRTGQMMEEFDKNLPILESLMNTAGDVLEKYGIILRKGDVGLDNLQQGISAVTEDTALALEAYMNGVSQQVYAHTELLTEIRDAVVTFNGDAILGVQSQMLLQLQNNYIVMQTMNSLMDNWTVPSGNGIRVELMN